MGDGEGPADSVVGAPQRRYAAAAVAAWARVGVPCDVAAALRAVVHPGRFEVFERFILDGAHNPHGAAALAATLASRGARPTLVLAVSADKDAPALVRALAPVVTHVIATRYQQERAMAPEALAAIVVRLGLTVEIAPDLASAIALTTGETLIAGSLFLVGEARALLCGAPTDPIYVTDPAARNLRV
ncbi:MAG: hypothetical protein NT062_39310 [Proteobacteria bacterium]|nr:hypothetical protein [Pseudomonadota bacterium]